MLPDTRSRLADNNRLPVRKGGIHIANTIYLVRKDPTQPPSTDNWIIMKGEEYYQFLCTPDGIQRKANFVLLPAEDKDGADIIIECDQKTITEWRQDLNRHDYLQRGHTELGYTSVSLYAPVKQGEGTITWEEVLPDPGQQSVEDSVFLRMDKESLRDALRKLSDREQHIVYLLFFRVPPLSVSECAKELHLARASVYYLRPAIIEKLRTLMNVVPCSHNQQEELNQ